jgi:sugar lactone lactonase YvrE
MRPFRTIAVSIALVLAFAAPATGEPGPFPDVIELPDGFFPEGIATGNGHTGYVGSLADGAIWRTDLRTGTGELLVSGVEGRIAVGMAFDARTGRLYVAGGPDGNAYVYDAASGDLTAISNLVPFGFVNDVIVTNDAAYFTDSFAPQIYALPLTPSGEIAGDPVTIPLGGDFQFEPGQFNANGIEVTANGRKLIVVNGFFGEIYTVDPSTGVANAIDLGGAVVNGDGLVLAGRTLYAVEGGKNQITKISLAPDLSSGVVVDALISDAFDVPTTAARFGESLYAVNAKFGTVPLPTTPYEIVRVDR